MSVCVCARVCARSCVCVRACGQVVCDDLNAASQTKHVDRAETLIGTARAAYLRHGFGGSWTQPKGLQRHYVVVREAARAVPIIEG